LEDTKVGNVSTFILAESLSQGKDAVKSSVHGHFPVLSVYMICNKPCPCKKIISLVDQKVTLENSTI
jgi:hypothetical protein